MNHRLSDNVKSALFGKLYVTDERVQAGSDKAGHYAFAAVFACLLFGLLYSLFFDDTAVGVFSMLVLLAATAVYIFFLVKNGCFQAQAQFSGSGEKPRRTSRLRKFGRFVLLGAGYAALLSSLRILAMEERTAALIGETVVGALIQAVMWVFLFTAMMKALSARSSSILDRKIGKNPDGPDATTRYGVDGAESVADSSGN